MLSLQGVTEGSQITLPTVEATTNLACTANVSGVSGSPEVVFSLEGQGVARPRLTSGVPYAVTFSNLPVGKYFLFAHVATATNVSSDVSFEIALASRQPANDLWSQAITIPNLGTGVSATNTFATAEAKEPVHAGNGAGRSVWWSWQAGVNGTITATTDGSGFDTVLAVYTGTNVGALSLLGANDDAGFTNRSSQVTFPAQAGTLYHFAVDSAVATDQAAESGVVQLRLLAASPPSVSLISPTNGQAFFTRLTPTNVAANAAVSDSAGLEQVEFALDGGIISRRGALPPPFQWNLTNLPPGDYLLTVSTRNNLGLVHSSHASFSVVSLAPELVFVDSPIIPAGFQFAVTGVKGTTYELQAATNLMTWSRLTLWTNFDGALRVADTNAGQFSARYYRVVSE